MAGVLSALAAVFVVFVALSGPGVSARTHHIVGDDRGWGPELDVNSWLSGRVFRVGDKILFKTSGTEDSIVEVGDLDEFVSCNLTNPIRMYTEPVNHVTLDEEGIRYFTSGNPESCKNGLKLPVPVHPPTKSWPPIPDDRPYPPSHDVRPPGDNPPLPPSHDFRPPDEPVFPPPGPPPPPFKPPSPPKQPSAAAGWNPLSLVVITGLLICYMSI